MVVSAMCGFGSVAFAAASGFLVGRSAWGYYLRQKRVSASLFPRQKDALRRLVRNGVPGIRLVSDRIADIRFVRVMGAEAVRMCSERGLATSVEALASLLAALCLLLTALTWLLLSSPLGGVCLCACLLIALAGFLHSSSDRRVTSMREQVPEALRSMSVCFQAGLSLEQVFAQVAMELGGPLGSLFSRAARSLETGGSTEEALSALREQESLTELSFVAVALDVQHQSGGSMAHVLDVARQSVEEDLELRRSLQVQTAQAKMSAQIVTLMPFILIALFSLMSEGFLNPFFESFLGLGLLVAALLMQAAGVLLVRRMLNVEVG